MRILICGMMYLPELNGQSIFTANLAEGMAARGHSLCVLMPGKQWRTLRFNLHGVDVVQLPALHLGIIHNDLRLSLLSQRVVRRELDRFKPDVVHVQDPSPLCQTLVREAHRRGIPVLATHHPGPEITAPYLMKSRPWIKHTAEKVAWDFVLNHLKQADMVTVPSRSSATMLADHGLDKSAWPVSCGTHLDDFTPLPNLDRAAVRARYGLNPAGLLLVYVGRIDIEKNINVLVDAMGLVEHAGIQLAIAGTGALDAQLRRSIAQRRLTQRVRLLGKVAHQDLPELINCADVFAMPGDAESFSIATLEAMACAKPVLAANAAALPELVVHGVNGYLFSARDPQNAAQWIDCLAEKPERLAAMSQASLERAQRHRLESVLERYEQIYQHTLRIYTRPVRNVIQLRPLVAVRRHPLLVYRIFSILVMLVFLGFSFSIGARVTNAEPTLQIRDVPVLDMTEIRDLLVISQQTGDEISGAGGVIQAVLEQGGSVRILVVPSASDPAESSAAEPSELDASEMAHAALLELGVPEEMVEFFEITPASSDEPGAAPKAEVNGAGDGLQSLNVLSVLEREASLFTEIKRVISEFSPDTILMPHSSNSESVDLYLSGTNDPLTTADGASIPLVFSYLVQTPVVTAEQALSDPAPLEVERDRAAGWFRYDLTDAQAQQKSLAGLTLESAQPNADWVWMNELFYQVPVQEWTLLENSETQPSAAETVKPVQTWLENYSGETANDVLEFHAVKLGKNLCISANAFAYPLNGRDEQAQRKSLGACFKFVDSAAQRALYINTWANKPADVFVRSYILNDPLK